ncbi:HGxxPAAW family protein [Streptomyces sp. NRRL S-455]|uniref:HGxxPAAW family protein n=1 Tax=Streptomyces sp. NRRL S-455 TaxID=1463908 RepID=UPI0004BF2278|nr:HGxxPAAW family protein [Streptomyces sp. NRRL S-455]
MSAHQYDHGHTVAGWVGCGIASIGAALVGAGVCFVSGVLIGGGLAIGVVALLVTWALHLAGWGKGPGVRPRDEWGWRVRDSGASAGHDGCLGCRLAGRRRAGRVTEVALPVRGDAGGEPEVAAAVGADSVR